MRVPCPKCKTGEVKLEETPSYKLWVCRKETGMLCWFGFKKPYVPPEPLPNIHLRICGLGEKHGSVP